jgi:hypothetical protein
VTRIQIDSRAADAYGIEGVLPVGAIIVTAGLVLRVREDGGIDEVGGVPRRKSIAADPTATRRP